MPVIRTFAQRSAGWLEMALDPKLLLRDLRDDEFIELVEELDSSRTLDSSRRRVSVVPTGYGRPTGSDIGTLVLLHPDRYDLLERLGFVAVGSGLSFGDVAADGLPLSGGSVCRTVILPGEASLVVKKTVLRSSLGVRDSRERHIREFSWLRDCSLHWGIREFPSVLECDLVGPEPSITLEFLPLYTLGERLRQGRESAATLSYRIQDAFLHLEDAVYPRRNSRVQESYIDIVARRFEVLVLASELYWRIWHEGVVVNGKVCPALKLLLSSELLLGWVAISQPDGGRECHGDLILEDILSGDASKSEVITKFVDPNPSNCSVLVDCGKIVMNLLCNYDLLYADRFRLLVSDGGRLVDLSVSFDDQDLVNILKATAELMIPWCVSLSRRWLEVGSQVTERTLVVQSALHCLALPIFHDLHHGSRDRGLAFAAIGMSLLADSLCSIT